MPTPSNNCEPDMTMEKLTASDPATESADVVAENIERLKALFPELVTEGKDGASINVDVLKQLVGDQTLTDADEKYGLNWFGKRRARQLALTPSTGTLRPCPEDSVDWDTTQNLMIEGDNLEVLKLLQKSYAGKVKLIYIDPPYNTGKDFVYPDNYQDSIKNYMELTGQVEGGAKLSSNAEASGRFHTDWLNMMYPRLRLARDLLREDGIIFISIGETELANLLDCCRQVFGEENSIGVACRVAKKSNNKGDHWAPNFDYIVTCSRDKGETSPFSGGVNTKAYDQVETDGPRKGELYQLVRLYMSTIENQNPEQRFWIECPDGSKVIPPGSTLPPERPRLGDGIWRWTKKKFEAERSRIVVKKVRSSNLLSDRGEPVTWNVFTKTYLNDVIDNSTSKPNNLIENYINQLGSHEMTALGIPFDYPKPSALVKFLCDVARTTADDLICDFFAGSGTTADAVLQLNASDGHTRKFILVQLPEHLDADEADQKAAADFCDQLGKPRNIAELTKERLRCAGAKVKADNPDWHGDTGFRVFKLDSSNIRAWEAQPEDLDKSLLDSIDHLKPGRTEADVLYELLLKLGLDLCVPIEERRGKQLDARLRGHDELVVHSVGGGTLIACLAEKIERDKVEALAQGIVKWHEEQNPAGDITCVFRDSAFADDIAKTNLAAILEQHGIANVRSL